MGSLGGHRPGQKEATPQPPCHGGRTGGNMTPSRFLGHHFSSLWGPQHSQPAAGALHGPTPRTLAACQRQGPVRLHVPRQGPASSGGGGGREKSKDRIERSYSRRRLCVCVCVCTRVCKTSTGDRRGCWPTQGPPTLARPSNSESQSTQLSIHTQGYHHGLGLQTPNHHFVAGGLNQFSHLQNGCACPP